MAVARQDLNTVPADKHPFEAHRSRYRRQIGPRQFQYLSGEGPQPRSLVLDPQLVAVKGHRPADPVIAGREGLHEVGIGPQRPPRQRCRQQQVRAQQGNRRPAPGQGDRRTGGVLFQKTRGSKRRKRG